MKNKIIMIGLLYLMLHCQKKNISHPTPNLKIEIPPLGESIPLLENPKKDARILININNRELIYSKEADKVPYLSKLNKENYIFASYKEFQGWVSVKELEYIYDPCPEDIKNIDLKNIKKGSVYSTERNTYVDLLNIERGGSGFLAFNNRFFFDNNGKGLFVELLLGICSDKKKVFKYIGNYPDIYFLTGAKRCPEGYTGYIDQYIDKRGSFTLTNVKYFNPEKEDFIDVEPKEPIVCFDECYVSCD